MDTIIIDVNILDDFVEKISADFIEKISKNTMTFGLISLETNSMHEYKSLGVTIADDITIQELNCVYRGLDEITDVLAFSTNYPGEYYGNTQNVLSSTEHFPNETGYAGEIVLSYPQCERQSKENNIPIDKELATLISHGILHLIGYDHTNESEMNIMKKIQSDSIKYLVDG
jgi:probable rRNA maturation factor